MLGSKRRRRGVPRDRGEEADRGWVWLVGRNDRGRSPRRYVSLAKVWSHRQKEGIHCLNWHRYSDRTSRVEQAAARGRGWQLYGGVVQSRTEPQPARIRQNKASDSIMDVFRLRCNPTAARLLTIWPRNSSWRQQIADSGRLPQVNRTSESFQQDQTGLVPVRNPIRAVESRSIDLQWARFRYRRSMIDSFIHIAAHRARGDLQPSWPAPMRSHQRTHEALQRKRK